MKIVPKKILASGLIVLLGILVVAVLFFNRAPVRTIPQSGIVSPTSGRVIAVQTFPNAHVVFEKKNVVNYVATPEISGPVSTVVIEMNLGDVHVQRAPIDGTIIRMDHYDGQHQNALGPKNLGLVTENEKMVTIFQDAHQKNNLIGVVQVAGMIARRIRNRFGVGDSVQKGQIYGKIILGSQVVVILPSHYKILAHVGDRLIDGESVIAQ